VIRDIVLFIIGWLDALTPKAQEKIVYASFPDLADNSFAIFEYVINNKKGHQNVWLVDSVNDLDKLNRIIRAHTDSRNYRIVSKRSLKGLFEYLTAKYVFFTHGLFSGAKVAKEHVVVNLWHGMPLKSIGSYDKSASGNNVCMSTFSICTSEFFRGIIARSFDLGEASVRITGLPRNDLLLKEKNKECLRKVGVSGEFDKIYAWLPTYRKATVGDVREDGSYSELLPFFTVGDLSDLNVALSRKHAFMVVKIHPMDFLNSAQLPDFSNVKILKSIFLEQVGVQLYDLLANVDILITDYSSVFIDFMVTGRPIAFIADDIETYSKTRGFLFDFSADLLPGDIISSKEELIDAIANDSIAKKYDKLLPMYSSTVPPFSKNVYDQFVISR